MPGRDSASWVSRAAVGRGQHAVEHALLLVALAALAAGYAPLLEGRDWWTTMVLVAGAVLLASGLLRVLRAPVAPVGGLLAGVLLVCWMFAAETLLFAILPTPATVQRLGALLDRAGTIIVEEPAPVSATAPVVLVAAGAFGLVAVAADVLLQRRGGVPVIGVLLVAVHVVPSIVVEETPAFAVLVVAAAAWLVLFALARPREARGTAGRGWRSSTVAAAIGLGALVAAALLPPVLPDTSRLTGVGDTAGGGVFERGINPMLRLGDDLRRNSPTIALEYTTEGPAPYLAVAMLREFTGDTWEPVASGTAAPEEGRSDVSAEVDVAPQLLDVRVRNLRSTMLPVPYPAVDVSGLDGSWELVRAGLTWVSDSTDTRDQRYQVTSLERRPTAAYLANAPEDVPPALEPYLALPDDLPPVITQAARDVAGTEVGAYAKARALQEHFRSGAYEYSEVAPVDGDYDGDGAAVIERFLAERSGYCVHFASAMAVMARALDVPARIMVGYAPGQPRPSATGSETVGQRYEVGTDDLHAWPQVYVDGVGWLDFEPTPGIAGGSTGPAPQDGADAPAPAPAPEPEALPEDEAPEQELGPDGTTVEGESGATRSPGVVALASVLVLLLVPALVRWVLRRRRLRPGAGPDFRWREVVATARDLGMAVTPATTMREHASALAEQLPPELQRDLEQLVTTVERHRYGPPPAAGATRVADPPHVDGAAAAVVAGLLAGATPARRLRARLLPSSLRG